MRTRGGTFCIISSCMGRSSFEGSGLWSLHEILELGARGFFFHVHLLARPLPKRQNPELFGYLPFNPRYVSCPRMTPELN